MNDQKLKDLWQAQASETTGFSEEDLGRKARALQRRVALRNLLEYVAGAFVIAGFSWYIWAFPAPLMRAGSALIIIATLLVLWQLHRRASSRPLPRAADGQASREFHRAQLVRQRDALRAVWLWYVAPFVPGMVLFRWGVETQLPADAPFTRGLAANLAIAAVLLAIVGLNLWSARKLQQQIDRLDRDAPARG